MGKQFSAWSDSEIAILREKAGKVKASEIGKEVGRGASGVLKMAQKLGLPSWKAPITPPPVRLPKPVKAKVEKKVAEPKPKPVAKPVALRKPEPKKIKPTDYSPLDYCEVHHCLVSNWGDHIARLGGCRRPAA